MAISFASWLFNYSLSKAALLDFMERAAWIALFGYFEFRMLASLNATFNSVTLLLVVSEFLPTILILTRKRSGIISDKPSDWVLAFSGASAPLLAVPGIAGTIFPQELCFWIMLTGLMLQISAKIILWQNFAIVAGNRGVKVAGPYRFVRHPMYAGYMITHIGFLMAFPSLYNTALYSVTLAIQVIRLLREERLLNNDPSYRKFSSRVRFRLLPGVF
jgi:protein-S-isoprenylcysteine O-methyltransferase Ste14